MARSHPPPSVLCTKKVLYLSSEKLFCKNNLYLLSENIGEECRVDHDGSVFNLVLTKITTSPFLIYRHSSELTSAVSAVILAVED